MFLQQLALDNEEYKSCKSSAWKECKTKVRSISSPVSTLKEEKELHSGLTAQDLFEIRASFNLVLTLMP